MKKNPMIDSENGIWWRTTKNLDLDFAYQFRARRLRTQQIDGRSIEFLVETFPSSTCDLKYEVQSTVEPDDEISKWMLFEEKFDEDLSPSETSLTQIEIYRLSDVPFLHRRFAALGTDERTILKFCQEFGFLGTEIHLLRSEEGVCCWGECVAQWKAEIRFISLLIELWDLVRTSAKEDDYRDLIDFEDDSVSFANYRLNEEFNQYSVGVLSFTLPQSLLKSNSLSAIGLNLLQMFLEGLASEHCITRIQIKPFPRLRVEAYTLLGTIYMHLINEVLGKSLPLVKCQVCEQWFQSRHKGTMYCSDACKVKAYRLRKEKEKLDGKAKK